MTGWIAPASSADSKAKSTTTDSTASSTPQTGGGATRVIAKTNREGKKDNQMSFSKGDEIEVTEAEGSKWHTGILRVSTTYPLTGQALKYPANFVKPKPN